MEYTVNAVQEALGVLMIVAHNPGLGVTEIARRSGNTKARTYRFLVTLEEASFVQRERDSTVYNLGHKALVLGLAAQEQVSLRRMADKYLSALQAQFNEHSAVLVRDDLESVSISHKLSSHEVRVQGGLGRRRPLYAGASGKVLLAFAPAELQAQVLDSVLTKFTPQTITAKSKLKQELKRISEQGYATSVAEIAPDVFAIAAPVFDARGEVHAAIGISLPSSRTPMDLTAMVNAVTTSAAELSHELGWRPV